jgi:hypothetical protein
MSEKHEMTEAEYENAQEAEYQKYAAIRKAYEDLLRLEDDPRRAHTLEAFLEDLNEENK